MSYCSWSEFKRQEWSAARESIELSIGGKSFTLGQLIELDFINVSTSEPLLRDLEKMVIAKAESAYRAVKVPCLVEHAGLILQGFEDQSYPGGLTQPMWDALTPEEFVASCSTLSKKAIARAVIGYCDGLSIRTFVGETSGTLADAPRGSRQFYWDTIFCPDEFEGKTYAEVAEQEGGVARKVQVSQSIKALKDFVIFRVQTEPALFPGI